MKVSLAQLSPEADLERDCATACSVNSNGSNRFSSSMIAVAIAISSRPRCSAGQSWSRPSSSSRTTEIARAGRPAAISASAARLPT